MSLLSPPPSARTPLCSFDGCDLVLHCPKCGPRTKPVHELYEKVRKSKPIGEILPHMTCRHCGSRPVMLTAVCSWIADSGGTSPRENLSFLLPTPVSIAA